jgi:hypothetical protein
MSNKEHKFSKFNIVHKKILNDEFLLIELENSGIIKIKYSKEGVNVILYTSQSLESIQGLSSTHDELKQ